MCSARWMAAWTWCSTEEPSPASDATTVDVTEPYWRVIKEGAVEEKEIAEVLKGA